MSLYVCVTGYTDAPGHTEYIITTDFEDTAGKRHSVSKMHRFSAFQDLHADIQLKLGLPTTLPVAKTLMTTSAVKDERVVKFQEYLRNAVAKCGSEPHPALSRFLGVDPKAVDGSKTIGPSATGGAPSSGGGGGASGGGGADDPALDGLLDNLVGQLLSKDVMLEPMQHLHAEFPRYLAAHAEKLRPDDLARYRKQQEAVAAILRAYETEPDNADRIAELMQQMQAYGAPPPEIAGPVADGACTVS